MKHIIFAIFFSFLSSFLLSCPKAGAELNNKVYVIDISGDVEPGMAAFVKRALRDIPEGPNNLIVFKMDTFGGRVDSALQIVDTIVNTKKGRTIAFVSKKAISAGALIALSCNEIAMKHNTTIGDCAPITISNEGPKMMGEKFQSPLRAKFRTLAKRNKYPVALSEAMVTDHMEVYKVKIDDKTIYMDAQEYADLSKEEKEKITLKKTAVAKGELLTMDDTEALDFGFSKMSVESIDEMLAKMKVSSREKITIEQSWSETFLRFITTIAPILMMIGLAAIYTEVKAPGFGVPGIIGIICLTLVFMNQYTVGLADHTEFLLVMLGAVLLGLEVFVIPGFGIAGISGMFCIAAGMILALQDFVIPDPALPWEAKLLVKNITMVLTSFIFAFIASLALLRYVLPKVSKVISGPYLDTTLEDSHADSKEAQGVSIGDAGVAMTFLRPSGKMKIGNNVFDVITEGEFLEKGTAIVVLDIQGNRVIVSKKDKK
jgi:membrane-bound serine protease (ClpP class)